MKTGLIIGVTGQDGSYLAEQLLDKGYRVIGMVRDSRQIPSFFSSLIGNKIEFVEWDMLSQTVLPDILSDCQPDEIYNYAAYSSGEGMFDDPVSIGEVNGLGVARILQAILEVNKSIRFCQASSSEMFGNPAASPQTEKTQFIPRSPYGAAKLYAHSMIRIYREHYGLFASSAILFNHESPRRGLGFVSRKIVYEAVRIKLGLSKELCLGNLDARRDWGFAGDYTRAMWLMLQQEYAEDYVVATGEIHSVRELCEVAFGCLELDYRDYVREDSALCRSDEFVPLVGNPEKAKKQLGWEPEVKFEEMIKMMVDADLRKVKECIEK
ncbi:MAG: GDP-mannose 4,6-dehydratase [Candidatus Omnitrophota bacterium]